MFRRFFCLFSAFTVLFFCSVPVFATGTEIGPYTGGGLGPVIGSGGVLVELQADVDVVELADRWHDKKVGYGNFLWHLINEDVCTHAPQLRQGLRRYA